MLLRFHFHNASPSASDVASTVVPLAAAGAPRGITSWDALAGTLPQAPDRSGPESTIVPYTPFIQVMQSYFTSLPYILILSSQTPQKDYRLPCLLSEVL